MGHTLTWEKGRQLKKFDNIEYTYNANGIRTSKKVNGVLHTYTLDGTKILRETWDDNTLIPLVTTTMKRLGCIICRVDIMMRVLVGLSLPIMQMLLLV